MSLLRLHCSLSEPPPSCRWALVNEGRDPVLGEGGLATLPRHAQRVQVVLPAAQVVFVRVRLPPARQRPGSQALAFAAEGQMAGDPGLNQVLWLGKSGDDDVLAVFEQAGFEAWRNALVAAGVHAAEWQAETLLLPWQPGRWHLRWNGTEGFLRTGEFEGLATDRGSGTEPPVALRRLLAQARDDDGEPTAIVLHPTVAEALPDLAAWARALGVPCEAAGVGDRGDWTLAPLDAGVALGAHPGHWRILAGIAPRLRTAAWILAIALGLHGLLLMGEWAALANEQRNLRVEMEARFREAFPQAVAVADPALQMRRQLAQARHAAGQVDPGDFQVLIGRVAEATRDLPPGSVRVVSYEGSRLSVELMGVDAAGLDALASRMAQAGLQVDSSPPAMPGAASRLTVQSP